MWTGLAGGINSRGLKFFSPALRPLIFSEYGIVFHGVKRSEHEADHVPLSTESK